jgi:predicted MPP superfamily phosphohydrolase
MQIALYLFAFGGHIFFWVGLINRVHSLGLPRWVVKSIGSMCFGCMGGIPFGIALWLAEQPKSVWTDGGRQPLHLAVQCYFAVCCAAAVATVVRLICRRVAPLPAVVRSHHCQPWRVPRDQAAAVEQSVKHFLSRLPGNEVLHLEVSRWTLEAPRLPPALDGLTIAHLSDLHFTGWIGKPFFCEVVRLCNAMKPDLVAVTGDLIDVPECIDWIPDTLGQLTAKYGVYSILGNHDLRLDADRIRRTLVHSGLVDLGGRWTTVEIRGQSVVLAGNELPWLAPAADLSACPTRDKSGGLFRIALAHTPDQFAWARASDVDLLLAGHTHGGQIRIPPFGPIFSPTFHGVRFISGVFYREPTILHVTRGISSIVPVRKNCPPELAMLELRSPAITSPG